MLSRSESTRPTAAVALKHAWFRDTIQECYEGESVSPCAHLPHLVPSPQGTVDHLPSLLGSTHGPSGFSPEKGPKLSCASHGHPLDIDTSDELPSLPKLSDDV